LKAGTLGNDSAMKIWYQLRILWSPYWSRYGPLQSDIWNLACKGL